MNASGKVIVVFLVVIAILLISLTAISMFFFQKEIERRRLAEYNFSQSLASGMKVEDEAKSLQKQVTLLQEKNKEVDEKINNLLDEIELQQGLNEELKRENGSLKEQVALIRKEKEDIVKKSSADVVAFEQQVTELKNKLSAEAALRSESDKKAQDLVTRSEALEKELTMFRGGAVAEPAPIQAPVKDARSEVQLEPIVVMPTDMPDGRILSVDADTEFVIINLGEKDGVSRGAVLSVYRGKEYLGDVKVTRVQPEMSAADFIPPFSSRLARKNDQVVAKK